MWTQDETVHNWDARINDAETCIKWYYKSYMESITWQQETGTYSSKNMDISTAKLTIFTYRHVIQYVSVVVWFFSSSCFYTIYFRTLNFQFWKCSNCICHRLIQKTLLHYVAQPWFIISDQYHAESPRSKIFYIGTKQEMNCCFIIALFFLCFPGKTFYYSKLIETGAAAYLLSFIP